MKSEEQIKEIRIQLGREMLLLNEEIKTFESRMGRSMTAEENSEMASNIVYLGGKSAMLSWILEPNQITKT